MTRRDMHTERQISEAGSEVTCRDMQIDFVADSLRGEIYDQRECETSEIRGGQ